MYVDHGIESMLIGKRIFRKPKKNARDEEWKS